MHQHCTAGCLVPCDAYNVHCRNTVENHDMIVFSYHPPLLHVPQTNKQTNKCIHVKINSYQCNYVVCITSVFMSALSFVCLYDIRSGIYRILNFGYIFPPECQQFCCFFNKNV